MSKKLQGQIKQRIDKLTKQINELRFRYHVLDDPATTDEVYDSLTRELKTLLEEYPEFDNPKSPLNKVAGKPLDKFLKVKHQTRMLSLNDAFSYEELAEWEKRIKKLLPQNSKFEYFCEVKFDGLAVSLIYENGKFVRGTTRGDGLVGEDITQNLKTIESIPLFLPPDKGGFRGVLEVRGEALMSKKTFTALNKKNKKDGKTLFANTRNAAAGSLRQLDPQLAKERHLNFVAYDMSSLPFTQNHSQKHEILRELGFKVEKLEAKCKSLPEVIKFIEKFAKVREKFPYGTDGIVIS